MDGVSGNFRWSGLDNRIRSYWWKCSYFVCKQIKHFFISSLIILSFGYSISFPGVVIKPDSFDLKDVLANQVYKSRFSIYNTGKTAIEILDVRPDCGCTDVIYKDRNIAPGESLGISFSFKTIGLDGVVKKRITVYTNDPVDRKRSFILSATIKNELFITPRRVLTYTRNAEGVFSIKNTGKKDFRIDSIFFSPEKIDRTDAAKYNGLVIKAQSTESLNVHTTLSRGAGNGRIVFYLNSEVTPFLKISYYKKKIPTALYLLLILPVIPALIFAFTKNVIVVSRKSVLKSSGKDTKNHPKFAYSCRRCR